MIGRFKQKTPPPPGSKLVRDWNGKRVRTLEALTNAWMTLPAGTIATVETSGGIGLKLDAEPCPHCGVRAHISRVPARSVEVIDDGASVGKTAP